MIEKLLKLATMGNPQIVDELFRTSEELKTSPFADDYKKKQIDILESAENQMPKLARKLDMSLGELDAYLSFEIEKNAAGMGAGAHIGRALGEVGLSALGSVARLALNDLYHTGKGALTEKRYYEKMMKENPDLHDYPQERVKSLFKTLHTLGGSELSSDPNVAGTFVRGNALYGDKGVDIKGVNDLIGARSNLQRSRDVMDGPNGTPGLGLLQRMQEEEKNRQNASQFKTRFDYDKGRHDIEDKRYETEDNRRSWEHSWKGQENQRAEGKALREAERHNWEHRSQGREEKEHAMRRHLGDLDSKLKSLDLAYKYKAQGSRP